jgi:hypothetical protein
LLPLWSGWKQVRTMLTVTFRAVIETNGEVDLGVAF